MAAGLIVIATGVTNAQGVDSTRAGSRMGHPASQGTVRFIDKDGDGICDDRASGLGFRRAGRGMNRMMNITGTGAGAGNDAGTGAAGMGRGKKYQKGQKR